MALTANLTRGNPLAIDMATQTAIGGGAGDADQNVFMTGGRLFATTIDNSHSSRATLKLYDSKSVTVGTTAPAIVIALNGSAQNGGRTTVSIATGVKFGTAFSMAATDTEVFARTTDPDDTTLEVVVVFARTTDV
ncbi:hypothetical protein CMI37_36110 [Candidatus Pacearchaeota archaeon]|nr:hypothetical protein [Candidatus Pacearchaeota archaeon]